MAQALFEDEHPLELYLRDAGEVAHLLPGASPDDYMEVDSPLDVYEAHDLSWMPPWAEEIFAPLVATLLEPPSSSAFAERFKYTVISSSLLSSSLSPPHPARTTGTPLIPGDLSSGHSHTPSTESANPDPSNRSLAPSGQAYWPYAVAAGTFGAGFYITSIFLLSVSLYYISLRTSQPPQEADTTPTLDALQDLIEASNAWDNAVGEALQFVDSEETMPRIPASPSSSLRVTLHTSLHTTETQCDNIRQLFSAVTSTELSQISEMYAPPSPQPRQPPDRDSSYEMTRPFSLPGRRRRVASVTSPSDKRSTWNGSYASLAHAARHVEITTPPSKKRRSDLFSVLQPPTTEINKTLSAPTTPCEVPLEEADEELDADLPAQGSFGVDALDLHRKRRAKGMSVMNFPTLSNRSSMSFSPRTPRTPRTPLQMSASKFTTLHTHSPRNRVDSHPLSASSIQNTLARAISAKRYAASHLLALRFELDGSWDDAYWEDVRSVMELLTSTLADTSSRVLQALQIVKDEMTRCTPSPSPVDSADYHFPPLNGSSKSLSDRLQGVSLGGPSGFAPMPGHLSRFAAHVDTICSALQDARENLEQCVDALRNQAEETCPGSPSPCTSPTSPQSLPSPSRVPASLPEEAALHPALEAYENLRRELGLALRECERGRERLLDLVSPRPNHEDEDDVPALGPDLGSDGSDDKHDYPQSLNEFCLGLDPIHIRHPPDSHVQDEEELDDVTAHLLEETSAQHLPAVGAERVYEADEGAVGAFSRERSKLSREERIKLMKERRKESGSLHILNQPVSSGDQESGHHAEGRNGNGMERWGPGTEVVQELKDVIWEVAKRRRKAIEDQAAEAQ